MLKYIFVLAITLLISWKIFTGLLNIEIFETYPAMCDAYSGDPQKTEKISRKQKKKHQVKKIVK